MVDFSHNLSESSRVQFSSCSSRAGAVFKNVFNLIFDAYLWLSGYATHPQYHLQIFSKFHNSVSA